MNTDDRALADLIERARARLARHSRIFSPEDENLVASMADRLEAFHAKPPASDVEIVRAVLHAHKRAMTPPDSGWGNMSYLKGSYDDLPVFQAALAAYRAALQSPPPVVSGEAVEPNLLAVMTVINDMRRAGENKWADRVQDALEGDA